MIQLYVTGPIHYSSYQYSTKEGKRSSDDTKAPTENPNFKESSNPILHQNQQHGFMGSNPLSGSHPGQYSSSINPKTPLGTGSRAQYVTVQNLPEADVIAREDKTHRAKKTQPRAEVLPEETSLNDTPLENESEDIADWSKAPAKKHPSAATTAPRHSFENPAHKQKIALRAAWEDYCLRHNITNEGRIQRSIEEGTKFAEAHMPLSKWDKKGEALREAKAAQAAHESLLRQESSGFGHRKKQPSSFRSGGFQGGGKWILDGSKQEAERYGMRINSKIKIFFLFS